jgi:HlyD family secretion protein
VVRRAAADAGLLAVLGAAVLLLGHLSVLPATEGSLAQLQGDGMRYVTVSRGDIVQNVTAAGTLEPVETVDISSQLSGQIAKVMADYNSPVRANEALAALDDATYEVMVKEAEGAFAVAQAQYAQAKAAIEGAQARYDEAIRDQRVKGMLAKSGGGALRDAERAEATAQALAAELSAARAQEQLRAAGILAARAALRRAQIDLSRTIIRSPLDGVVIRRSVEVGQILAASLQPPTLFTIARDLSDMRVNASVSEADIGAVRIEQRATFTVDAYPGCAFDGRVIEIRKAPRIVQNVVTYTVMISARNPQGLLFPGMTADVRIIVQEHSGVLVVPNATLSFRPAAAERTRKLEPRQGVVWVRTPSGHLAETIVSLGATGESLTEVASPALKGGEQIAVGYQNNR